MSLRSLISMATVVMLFVGSTPAYGQRNIIEGIIGGAIDQALRKNNVQRPQPTPQEPPIRMQQALPNEGGQKNISNPYDGGLWKQIRPQPQPNPQPYVPPRQIQPQPQPWQPQPQPQPWQPQPRVEPYPQQIYPSEPPYPPVKKVVAVDSIKITLPRSQGEACSFTLINGSRRFARSLTPGQMQKLKGTPNSWNISFNGPAGTTIYRLRDDTDYVFQSQGSGIWQLYKVPKAGVVPEPPLLPQYQTQGVQ